MNYRLENLGADIQTQRAEIKALGKQMDKRVEKLENKLSSLARVFWVLVMFVAVAVAVHEP